MNISIDKENNRLTIDQHEYVEKLIRKFGMENSNPSCTPMDVNVKLVKNEDDKLVTDKPYRELIGSLMYLMLATRPDLCFTIGYLSRFQDKPTELHWSCLQRVVRYLKHTNNYALYYEKQKDDVTPLQGFVDADWANDINDRKSTSGYLLQAFGNIVVWSSKKQGMVAKSTSEAEYIAACEACAEAIWLSKIYEDLHVNANPPIVLYEDNMGCLFMAENPETKRSKHIDIKFHYLRECVWEKKIKLKKVDTKDQTADCLTKILGKTLFQKCTSEMGLRRVGVSE